jgi:hypothetical protein
VRNAHILTPLQQEQQDNSRISCVFLVHAPQTACDYLDFSEDLCTPAPVACPALPSLLPTNVADR